MTKRQKLYRKYLESDHWKSLRDAAKERDGHVCVACGSVERIQVHHKVYRGNLNDGLLDDVETLCRKCHRQEHGLGPSDFESKWRELEQCFRYARRPLPAQWQELKALTCGNDNINDFGELMFQYVMHVVANEREQFAENWWMDEGKNNFWFRRAFRVRKSIQQRINGNPTAEQIAEAEGEYRAATMQEKV